MAIKILENNINYIKLFKITYNQQYKKLTIKNNDESY